MVADRADLDLSLGFFEFLHPREWRVACSGSHGLETSQHVISSKYKSVSTAERSLLTKNKLNSLEGEHQILKIASISQEPKYRVAHRGRWNFSVIFEFLNPREWRVARNGPPVL